MAPLPRKISGRKAQVRLKAANTALDHGSRVLRRGLDQRQESSGAGIVDETSGVPTRARLALASSMAFASARSMA
jgi:hypothetical protein